MKYSLTPFQEYLSCKYSKIILFEMNIYVLLYFYIIIVINFKFIRHLVLFSFYDSLNGYLCCVFAGQKYFYNRKTNVSQWYHPGFVQQAISHSQSDESLLKRCMGCGGWGLALVKSWGYCNHCTRYSYFCLFIPHGKEIIKK